MDKTKLIQAILSGNKTDLQSALPKTVTLSHSEIERAFFYLCENTMPPNYPYYYHLPLNKADLSKVLSAFDMVYGKKDFSLLKRRDDEQKELFEMVHAFLDGFYTQFIDAGGVDLRHDPAQRIRVHYKPYYLTSEPV